MHNPIKLALKWDERNFYTNAMPREISGGAESPLDEVCVDTIMTEPKKNREFEFNLLPKIQKEKWMCVLRAVQYSPSGIFSDKICACNPLNRTAKVIRHSKAITAPAVSCVVRVREEKCRTFQNVYCDVRAGLEISSTQIKPMLSSVWLFRLRLARGAWSSVFLFLVLVSTSSFMIAYFYVGYYCCCVRLSSLLRFRQTTRSRFLLFPINVDAMEELPSVLYVWHEPQIRFTHFQLYMLILSKFYFYFSALAL